MHGEADVRDGALAEPGHEEIADGRGDRHHAHQHQQILKPARDIARAAGGEAFVDDQLERVGNARRRRGGDEQGDRRDRDLPGVVEREPPHHPQVPDGAALRAVGEVCHCQRQLAARGRRL